MRISVIEDDFDFRGYLSQLLLGANHLVHPFNSGDAFIKAFRHDTFDLVIIDWNLPTISGIDLLKWLRTTSASKVPTVMVTSRSCSEDVATAFEFGADDYVSKPFDGGVLLARLSALERRFYSTQAPASVLKFGIYEFNVREESLQIDGEAVMLTHKEFHLAVTLFNNLARPLSRKYLLERVWARNPDLATRTLDAHISVLRGKLKLRPENGFRLTPIYSYGYRLEAIDSASHPPSESVETR
jgi:DNA-binding response OmpR family regulator